MGRKPERNQTRARRDREWYPARNARFVDDQWGSYVDSADGRWLGNEAWESESEDDRYESWKRDLGSLKRSKVRSRSTPARSFPSSRREYEDPVLTTEMATQKSAERSARGPMSVRQKQWGLAKLGCQGNLGGEKFVPDESIVDKFLSEVGITWDNRAGHENPEERTEALFEALRREEKALKKEARILKSDLNVELDQRQWLLEELGLTEDDDGRLNNCDEIEAETLSLSTKTLDCIQATLSTAYTKGTAYKEGAPEYVYFEALDSVASVVTSLPSAIDDIAKKNSLLISLRHDELQGDYRVQEEERKIRRNSLASTADTIMKETRAKKRADEERARSWLPHW